MSTPPQEPGRPLDFARAFRFVLDDPDWIKKVLIGGAFTLLAVPLVGAPFVMGYWVRLLRNVARGEVRPLPEWEDLGGLFGDGLRGLGVYLGHLVALMALPASAGCVLALMVGFLGGAVRSGRGSDAAGMLAGVGMIGVYAVGAVLMMVLTVYVPAALLRFALYHKMRAGFEPREVVAVIQRNLGNYLLALVLYLVASFVAQFGILLCCIGLFPLSFWATCTLAWGLGEVARRDPVLASYGAPPALAP